jgi:hypothetical protein
MPIEARALEALIRIGMIVAEIVEKGLGLYPLR